MKAINKLFMGLALAAGLVGCKDGITNADPAAPETNAIQAYVYANTSNITVKPAANDSVQIIWAEGEYTSDIKVFPIVIGRRATKQAATLELEIDADDELFAWGDGILEFEAGQASDTLWVVTFMEFGQKEDFKLAIPQEFSTQYGKQNFTVSVSVEYTWEEVGTVTMTSEWEGASAVVTIERAKEFKNAKGDTLYRLVSPYYYIAPDYCNKEGFHIPFLLDKDYQLVGLYSDFIKVEDPGYDNVQYWYYDERYTDYCYMYNDGNKFTFSVLWTTPDGDLYSFSAESFVWDKGFPGELVDPAEGDSELDNIVFSSASYEIALDAFGDPVTVDEILDPVKYAADKYVFPESYIGHYLYYVTLSGANGTMVLELTGDEINGEYSFASYTTDGENLIGTAGMAQPGKWNGSSNEGCYLTTALSKYYLTGGEITITDTETTINVTSANGTEITATYAGEITEASAPGRKAKRLFTK